MRKPRKCRAKLYEDANGLCYYCGCKTIFPDVNNELDGSPNLATIEHLFSRFNPNRLKPNRTNERRRVLSCFKCNQTRAKLEEMVLFLKEGSFLLKEAKDGICIEKRKREKNVV